MKYQSLLLLTCIVLMLSSACKKYPEGPAMSLRSKKSRVANSWKIEKYLINGIDSTAYYAATGTIVDLDKKGNVTATQIESNGTNTLTTTYVGTWEFSDNKEAMGWFLTDNITNTLDTTVFFILKLKEKEMWLEERNVNGNQTAELHFVPN